MAILIKAPSRIKKLKAGNAEEILRKLEKYLESGSSVPIKILGRFWQDQRDVITYKELREAVISGELTEQIFNEWSKDYSILVKNHLYDIWKKAMEAGSSSQPITLGLAGYSFNTESVAVITWMEQRGAFLATNLAMEQKEAIQALLIQSVREKYSVDELARFIRSCIGLTKGQAKANLRYYDSVVNSLKEQHPKMKKESIQRKAREAAAKYASRQHKQRALTITQTEMATAYNKGADEGIRQAQEQNLLGEVKKRWCTSGDDMVCEQCKALEGTEVSMNSTFAIKGETTGDNLFPPAHPRCACAVEYIEVS